MKNKRFKQRSSALVFVLSLLGILLIVNLISLTMFGRLDLTEGKIYSLTSASVDLVNKLDDQVLVKAFFSEDLPAPYSSHRRYLRDILEDYRAFSNGKVKYEFVDPTTKELEKEAQSYGIQAVQLQDVEKHKLEIKKVYMGLAFRFTDKKEVIPMVRDISGLEYQITTIMKKFISDEQKKVGFLTGHGEPNLMQGLKAANEGLSNSYQVTTVSLAEGKAIDESLDALLVVSPREKLADWDKFQIDQFIMKGKAVAFLVDGMAIAQQQQPQQQFQMANQVDTGIEDMLEHYGVKHGRDLVLDLMCDQVRMPRRVGNMVLTNIFRYPALPALVNLNKESMLVKDLGSITLPFASSLSLTAEALANPDVEAVTLASSSDKSWQQTGFFIVDPGRPLSPGEKNQAGPFVMALSLMGKFKSFYADKPAPMAAAKAPQAPEAGKEDPAALQSTAEPEKITVSTGGRLVVVGDGDFAQDHFAKPSNMAFLQNLVDWMVQDEALIAIRTKQVGQRPLEELSYGAKNIFIFGNIFGVPLVLALAGLVSWRIRLRRKARIQL